LSDTTRKMSVTVSRNSGHFSGSVVRKKFENRPGKLVDRCIVPIVCNPIVHDAPKELDWVEVRCICWLEMQLHPAFWAVEPSLKYLGMMIAGIVDKDMDGGGRVAWIRCGAERALPETEFRRYVRNWDGQVRSSD
jgi:hypothetical protein